MFYNIKATHEFSAHFVEYITIYLCQHTIPCLVGNEEEEGYLTLINVLG